MTTAPTAHASFAQHGAEAVNTEIDPFSDWVYREPRQPQFSVRDLNDAALKRLLGRFDRLIAGPLPRPNRRLDQAQLVVSPQPGYGKSHLIGRLFSALEGRATLIYVTPFHSPSLCWQSILLRMVQELTFPDRMPQIGSSSPVDEAPTQLDAFAHGVLAHLVAGLIESGKVQHSDPSGVSAWLRENPMDAFMLANPEHSWSQWMREVFEVFHRDMESALRRASLTLHSPGWLRVLFRYAASLPGDEARAHCLAWMSGQPLEPAEAIAIGLRPGELTPAETPDQINEICWRRLLDFCQLAAFYRPFVFCFDQTEAYGHSPALARCFGMVIAQIHLMAANEMMVVTANQQPWEETVARHMETADKDRFSPLPLEGIRRAQAEELVRRRCAQHDVPTAQVEAFLEPGWLNSRFPTERNRMGIRQFLQACSARWRKPEDWWHHGANDNTPDLPFGSVATSVDALAAGSPPALALRSSSLDALQPVLLSRIPRIGEPLPPGDEAVPRMVGVPPSIAAAATPLRVAAVRSGDGTPPGETPSLGELHDRYTQDLAAQPKRLLYHPDTFRWLVSEVARGVPGLGVEIQPEGGAHRYLPVTWYLAASGGQRVPSQVFFGFEAGDNWRRWRSILREVQDRCLPPPLAPAAAGQPVTMSKAVFLRTPEQTPIPGPGWEIGGELEVAKQTCFDMIELEETSVAEFYAARSLYLDAAAGDLPYSTEEVMAFLRAELGPLWKRIQEPLPGEPAGVFGDAALEVG